MPVKAEKSPSAYRTWIWESARRYHFAGDAERAGQCVQLNKLNDNSYVPAELGLDKDVFLVTADGSGDLQGLRTEDGVMIASHVILGGHGHPRRWTLGSNVRARWLRSEDAPR